ncbi:MAG: 16S rRNA (uracil(1498)-N(3))-methyltransferase [Maricaulaceae bacterium]
MTAPPPRLFHDAPLVEAAEIALDKDAAHYLGGVLRKGPGDRVRLFNARDGEWAADIVALDRKGGTVAVRDRLRAPAPVPDLDLLFAPLKKSRTDFVVEKATELGVKRLRPVLTARTIADKVRPERLAMLAREAAEQTERLDVPEIADAEPLAKALDHWNPARRLIYADEAGDDAHAPWGGSTGRARPILAALQAAERGPWAVLIGPEGGFTPQERERLRSEPFVVPVSLGPRILRAETAAVAALSLVQAVLGDWD